MDGSKGKSFPFKHCWALLQNLDKWKLRDQETTPKKSDMLKMDDSDEERRNHAKSKGNKKAKERMKMEAKASSLREKIELMIRLIIIEKKRGEACIV
jgi:hypothetical protein